MTEPDDRENYGSGTHTCYGYIAEWRLKPESTILEKLLGPFDVTAKWQRAPYALSELKRLGPDASKIIQPYLPAHDFGRASHGLATWDVAIAIIACIKTGLKKNLLPHIEWRLVLVRLEDSYKITRVADDDEDAKRLMKVGDLVTEVLDRDQGAK